MFKFLRKYNKWILAVFGSLLMIVFLIPQALTRLFEDAGRGGATRAKLDGKKVSVREFDDARRNFGVVETTGLKSQLFPFIERADHWYLLEREARTAGLVPAGQAVALPADQLNAMAVRSETSPRGVLEGVASAEGVRRLMTLYASAGQLSDRRLRRFGERMLHGVSAQVIQVKADADSVNWTPSEQELQQQFDDYADVEPGEGEMGFGYRLPDRFKLEWLIIDDAAVQAAVESSRDTNLVALYKHWRRYAGTEGIPAVVEDAAVPDIVRRHLVNQLTQERLDDIAKFATDRLRAAQRGLQNEGAFVALPDDWSDKMISMSSVAEQIQEEFSIPAPTYQSNPEWLTPDELRTMPTFSSARTNKFGTRPYAVADVLPGLKEFGGDGTFPVQANVALPPFRGEATGEDGSVVMVRAYEADAARAPRNLSEIREAVVADLKRKHHYEDLLDQQNAIANDARTRGMLPVAMDLGAPVQSAPNISIADPTILNLQVAQGFQPQIISSQLPGLGMHRPTVEAIIDRAMQLPLVGDLETVNPSQRVFVLPVDDFLSLYIVRLGRQNPLSEEVYGQLTTNNALQTLLLGDEFGLFEAETRAAAQEAFSFERLKERHNYEVIAEEDEETDAETGEVEVANADG